MNLQTLLDTPTGRTMVAELESEMAAQTLARRLELAAELKRMRTDTRESDKAAADVEKARAEVSKQNEQARAAVVKLHRAQQAAQAISSRDDRKLAKVETELRKTAPRDVRELRDWLDGALEATRRSSVNTRMRKRGGGESDIATHSTHKSLQRRLDYLVDARNRRVAEIALIPAPEDVRAACDEIKAKVPEIKMEPLR